MSQPYMKPCPFCGGKASMLRIPRAGRRTVYEIDCENTSCRVSVCTNHFESPEEAADAWNKRPVEEEDSKRFSGLIEEE